MKSLQTHRRLGIILYCFLMGCSFVPTSSEARRLYPEKIYQDQWCARKNGKTEIRQKDRTRVDCVTTRYAVEFDFGTKWAEAIGQSLHYSLQTGLRPGIVLILEKKSDYKYFHRLRRVIDEYHLGIQTWVMEPNDLENP